MKTGNARGYALKQCEECPTFTRRIWRYKTQHLCYICYKRKGTWVGSLLWRKLK